MKTLLPSTNLADTPSFRPKQYGLLLAAVFILIGSVAKAQLPTISYSSPQRYLINSAVSLTPASSNVAAPGSAYTSPVILGSGLTFPQNGLALDAAGNMYVNDQDAGSGNVKKIAADGSSTTIIGSGFVAQSGNVAVDQAGNVFVVDQAQVWKIPASGNPVTYGVPVVISNTFPHPFGIAVDVAGNLYVSDLAAGVYKMNADGSNKVRIDNGISEGAGLAVDAAGNVYVATISDLKLYEIPANGSPQVELATGFAFPRGLAVDNAGTIYIDDEGLGGIYSVPAGGGTPVAVIPGLTNLVGVAADGAGNLYGALQGSTGINKFSPTGGYFISPALPAGLSLDNTTGAINGTPTVVIPAKNYLVSAYNSSGGVSTTVNLSVYSVIFSYASPQTYMAGIAITALSPSVTAGTVGSPGYSTSAASIGSGFSSPYGVAVDAQGNIYVADAGNSAVKKFPAVGGAPFTIGSGFNYPTGVAVDANGNVYVADAGSGSVYEIPVTGSQVTLGGSFNSPNGVAVDASGNVFVIDEGAGALYKIPAGNGTPIILGEGFVELTAISIDQSGNLYVADGGQSAVFTVPAKGGIPVSLGGSFLYPTGIAADASGNLFVVDGDANTLYKLSSCGCTQVAVNTSFNSPNGLAIDGAGNLYVGDTNNNLVEEISPVGGYYLGTPLPIGLSLDNTTGEITGTAKSVSAAANYIINAYGSAGGYNSTALIIAVNAPPLPVISYATPQTYLAGTNITPLLPANSGGAVASPSYNTSFTPVGSGYNTPMGVALDAAGDVFVADAGRGQVEEFAAIGGGLLNTYTGFNYPTGVALDATGDIFVADQGGGQVYEITAGTTTPFVLGAFSGPNAVTVDPAGNVYVTDDSSGALYKLPAGNLPPVTLVTGFLYPTAITYDGAGNLYVVDGGESAVFKVSTSGGTPVPVADNFIFPTGIAIDPSGNLYITDSDAEAVFKLPANNFAQITVANGFNNPGGIAVDGAGNLYVGDSGNNAVDKITPAGGYFINAPLPTGLSLNVKTGAISGTATGASPATNYTITGYNTGGSSAAIVNITVNLPPPPTLSYAGPQVYTINTAITPLVPTSTGVSAPAYNSAIANIGSGYNFPYGVAIDQKGNLYVADAGNNAVELIPAGGGGAKFPIGGAGFSGPVGVAVDAKGNVFVADGGNSQVVKIPVNGSPNVIIGGTGFFNYPAAVAVDSVGNVYVADQGLEAVYKVAGTHAPIPIGSFNYPTGVAVDAAGDVFVTDFAAGSAFVLPAGGGPQAKIGGFFTAPTGIAVDASGNVFIADGGGGLVKELPAGGGSAVTITGVGIPYGLAADGAGNLYIGDVRSSNVDKVTPHGGFYITPALPIGLLYNSTSGTISGTPTAGSAATNYAITGYNPGGIATGTVNIKVISPNDLLSNIVLSNGNLSPKFSPADTSYTSSVANAINALTLTPTASDPGAAITVNGVAVASGSPSGSLPLKVGKDTIKTVVTSSDGTKVKTYTIIINRVPSGNANLANIQLSNGSLSPGFTGSNINYVTYVGNGLTTMTITPVAADTTSAITVNGVTVKSGSPTGFLTLAVGANTVTIAVAAQDGIAHKTYTVTINEARSLNNNLAGIATSAGYQQGKTLATTLTETVPYAISALTVTPTADDPTATITVNSASVNSGSPSALINLVVGQNTITTVVTAQNGDVKTYTLTVTRTPDVNLANLQLSNGILNPAFGTATNYFTYVGNNLTTMTVKPTAEDQNATIKVNGVAVLSGHASGFLTLTAGANTETIVVTGSDNVTTKTYTLVVNEARSSNNTLASLKTSGGLSKKQTVATTQVESVPNSMTSITVTPALADNAATVTVNNVAVTSGSPSAPIALNVGDNIITIVGTAQTGATLTYTLTVTRAKSANLSNLTLSSGSLSPSFASGTTAYSAAVANGVTSITLKPTAIDPNATIKVNGSTVASGSSSSSIPLSLGNTTILVAVTAADNSSTITYNVGVNRARSSNDALLSFKTSAGLAKGIPVPTTLTESVVNAISTITVTPTVDDATATVTVNGVTVASGTASASIALSVGQTVITTVVTAQSGVSLTYTLTVTRAMGSLNMVYQPVGVTKPNGDVQLSDDGINVHQGLSPNGDGINDFLQIDNISQYPDNNLKIMNRNGQLVYDAKGYDNATKAFDGHSSKNGQMQLPGTYFYSLDYTIDGVTKHKTGFLVLKY